MPSEPEPAGGNGYAITRSYYTMDGQPADIAHASPAGTRLVTVLEVTPFGTGEARLMVTDPLPAGFEIDNPNLISRRRHRRGWTGWGWKRRRAYRVPAGPVPDRDRPDRMPRRSGWPISCAPCRPGTFHHPAASVEDMYRPDFRARSDTGQVTVTP